MSISEPVSSTVSDFRAEEVSGGVSAETAWPVTFCEHQIRTRKLIISMLFSAAKLSGCVKSYVSYPKDSLIKFGYGHPRPFI